MTLIDDNEFIIIHVDETNEPQRTEPCEYIQMKQLNKPTEQDFFTAEKFENIMGDLLDSVIEEVVDDIVNEIKAKTITEQPKRDSIESQTNISYSIQETDVDDVNMKILEEYDYNMKYPPEEESCLHYYKPNKKYKKRKYKRPKNDNDCLNGFKRFFRYIFNI